MKLGLALLVVFAVGAPSADAAIFGLFKGKKSAFPKPLDYPIVRPKVREYHKPGSRLKHLSLGADAAIVSTVERA
jgi:hypothetical protein